MKTKEVNKKIRKISLFEKYLNEILDQIKNTHQTISAGSDQELTEKLHEYISNGWVLIGPTYFTYESQIFIHSQLIFKPYKPEL